MKNVASKEIEMGIVLYGAGTRGKKIEDLLYANGIKIEGFADSKKTKNIECMGGRTYPILGIPEILRGGA